MTNYKTKVLLYDLITMKIVKMKGGHYFYDEVQLGHGEESSCQYLDDPHNNELRVLLMEKATPTVEKKKTNKSK